MKYLNFGSIDKRTKIAIAFIVLLGLGSFGIKAQYVVKNATELNQLKEVPQELVHITHTGPVVFTGEYLYYAIHCFNVQTRRTSKISMVAYVALVDQNGKEIFEHKLRLERGKSRGDFFIPTSLPTGTYKLVGYTQWMKNSGTKQIYQDDVAIINPYSVADVKVTSSKEFIQAPQSGIADSSTVGLKFEKSKYGTREKVSFQLRNYKDALGAGTYSVWVKKKEDIPFKNSKKALDVVAKYSGADRDIPQKIGDNLFLPEQRGELIFGQVTDATGSPMADQKVILSFPGAEFLLKFATTDGDGNFYTYIREVYKQDQLILQTDNENNVSIQLKEPKSLSYEDLEYSQFTLKEEYKEVIQARSVHNQIENQFFEIKPDSVLLSDPYDPFDGGMPEEVFLDDFTRFPTFEETLVEILNNAGYRRGEEGATYIRILQDFETFNEPFNNYPALVLIDGVYIPDHGSIKNFDARRIESIKLIRDQFQLANNDYQGMMLVSTFDGDYVEGLSAQNTATEALVPSRSVKNYFLQDYSGVGYDRVPDYRNILLWKPQMAIEEPSMDLHFFTSDLTGVFEVYLDGFTTFGKPISLRYEIEVMPQDP
ncbi:MAG: Ig-like domain-containing protein [Eudoraea sp.]|nr:Ig-like domain-containing protein [Eudoraea sp.]